MKLAPPYLAGLRVIAERMPSDGDYPFCLPFVQHLDRTISSAVTIFVGTSHFQITRGMLENPARYWRRLRNREPG